MKKFKRNENDLFPIQKIRKSSTGYRRKLYFITGRALFESDIREEGENQVLRQLVLVANTRMTKLTHITLKSWMIKKVKQFSPNQILTFKCIKKYREWEAVNVSAYKG